MAKVQRDIENHDRIVACLKQHQMDGILCALPANVLLVTGYWPVMGDTIALFTSAGEMHLLLPEDENELAAEMSVAERTTFHPGTLDAITSAKYAVQTPLQQLFSRLGLQRARIGFELYGTEHTVSYLSQYAYQTTLTTVLGQAFTDLKIVSADHLLHHLDSIKTEPQLEAIRRACCIAGSAYKQAACEWQQEMTEPEVAEIFHSAYSKAASCSDVLRSDARFFCMSGENSAKANAAFGRTRNRMIKSGDAVMIHCNSNVNGYWTDITRTSVCGTMESRQERMQTAISEARSAALARISSGVIAAEVDKAARDVLKEHGFAQHFTHATGHGVGFSAANHNAIPRIHPKSPDVLETGMVFNVEPAIYIDGYAGMRHCDVVAVGKNGAEVLTEF